MGDPVLPCIKVATSEGEPLASTMIDDRYRDRQVLNYSPAVTIRDRDLF